MFFKMFSKINGNVGWDDVLFKAAAAETATTILFK